MAKLSALVLVTALSVTLTGCVATTGGQPVAADLSGGSPITRPSIEPPDDEPTPEPSLEPETSERGSVPKKVGELAGLCAKDPCVKSELAVEFTVDRIQVDPTCTRPYAPPPDNGHYIALSLTINTTAAFTKDMAYLFDFSPFSFEVVGPDGVTEASDPGYGVFGCLDGTDFVPVGGMTPSSRYKGVVVLDSKHTSGIIVLRMPGDPSGGWEWAF